MKIHKKPNVMAYFQTGIADGCETRTTDEGRERLSSVLPILAVTVSFLLFSGSVYYRFRTKLVGAGPFIITSLKKAGKG